MIETVDSTSASPENLILHWRQNPVSAAKDIFDVKLEPHQRLTLQQMWVNSNQTNILSRGTGKTFLDALCGSLEGILKPSYRVGLIGPSFRQSKLIWAEVEKLYEKSPIFQASVSKPPTSSPEKCHLKFKAAPGQIATVMEALPLGSDGSKIRGSRYFSTYVDEGAQVDKEILDVVVRGFMATSNNPVEQADMIEEQKKMLARGLITEDQMLRPPANRLVFSTTAFYQYNHAYDRVQKFIERFNRDYRIAKKKGQDLSKFFTGGSPLNNGQIPHRIMSDGTRGLAAFTCFDPREGFMNADSIREAREEMSEYKFLMEYSCFFPPDSEGFFRRSVLDKARAHGNFGPILEPREGCMYALGIDPARTSDNFSIALYEIDIDNQSIHLVRIWAWNNKNFPEMHIRVREIIRKFNVKYFEMDAGGGGTAIRDLLSDSRSCPAGQRLILEQDFDDHRLMVGDRLLGKLIQFSSYEWVHDANFQLLSALQHGRLQIAAKPPITGQVVTTAMVPVLEEADEEIEKALSEWASIVVTPAGSRMHWDTPTKRMRKDRYSAILIGFSAAQKVLNMYNKPTRLCTGFWL